jgi:zinc D-Ala-D-Ala carboxypeptidase
MRLTKHFTLDEFTRSSTGARLGLNNNPPVAAVERMKRLCQHVLEPIRAKFGTVRINSGYRGPALNKAVGGAAKSQHVTGEAADIECPAVSNYELAAWIRDNLATDQIILEAYTPGKPHSGWVHVSYRADGNRAECLTWERGYGYSKGLHG